MKLIATFDNAFLHRLREITETNKYIMDSMLKSYNVEKIVYPIQVMQELTIPDDYTKTCLFFELLNPKTGDSEWMWLDPRFLSCMPKLLSEGDNFTPQNEGQELAFELMKRQA